MALVEGYSLRHEGGAEPQDIRATHELAKRHNQSSSDKISIYKLLIKLINPFRI